MSAKKGPHIISIPNATMVIGYGRHSAFLSTGLGEISLTRTCFLTASIDKFSDSIEKGPGINRLGDTPEMRRKVTHNRLHETASSL
jgi:hypothetical protein